MQKNICKLVCFGLVILGLGMGTISAGENHKQLLKSLCVEESNSSEEFFLTTPEELSFDQENIVLNVEGLSYSVHSLQKIGDRWLATVSKLQFSFLILMRSHLLHYLH